MDADRIPGGEMNDPIEDKVERLLKHATWLSNDCGGCEICGAMFTQEMHDDLRKEVLELPAEYQKRFML